ncbi:hypothetical protein GE21DRAFT_1280964 [Neurospora crassa]|nr:hypothetical protein GE21DRAFT_1280964 [Neurospora crassa]
MAAVVGYKKKHSEEWNGKGKGKKKKKKKKKRKLRNGTEKKNTQSRGAPGNTCFSV